MDTSVDALQPEAIAPIPEAKSAAKTNRSLGKEILIAIAVFLVLGGILAIAYVMASSGTNPQPNLPFIPAATKLEVTTPATGTSINGVLNVAGSISGTISGINFELVDGSGQLLATENIKLTQGQTTWQNNIEITNSPKANNAELYIYPEGKTKADATKVNLVFATTSDTAGTKLKIYTPLQNQTFTSGSLLVRGEGTGFFEGHLDYRVRNAQGEELRKSFLTLADNYDKWVQFEFGLEHSTLDQSKLTQTGILEFFVTSANDGSEIMLLQVPLRLK